MHRMWSYAHRIYQVGRGRESPLSLLARAYACLLVTMLLLRRSQFTRASPLALAATYLPFAFTPIPAALAIAIASRDRWLQLVLGSLAGAFVGLYGHRFRPHRRTLRGLRVRGELRIITLNLFRDVDNAGRVAQLVMSERPDCFAAQELDPRTSRQLSAALTETYPFRVVHPDEGYKGLGWWSRYPLQEVELLRSNSHTPLALTVEYSGPSGSIRLMTAHPRAPDLGPRRAGVWLYSARRRDDEISLILQSLTRLGTPLVLAGDFNMTDQVAAYRDTTHLLDDAFDACGYGFGHTFPLLICRSGRCVRWSVPLLRLDYVFYTRDLQALEARVLPSVGSDHSPLLVTLTDRCRACCRTHSVRALPLSEPANS
jgi:endonuclease/exonuclease/phosphatase (EEP) superfamily protein YafD